MLVSQHKPRIEVFRRNEGGSWTFFVAEASESVELVSIECELAVDELFADPLANVAAS